MNSCLVLGYVVDTPRDGSLELVLIDINCFRVPWSWYYLLKLPGVGACMVSTIFFSIEFTGFVVCDRLP